MKEIPCGQRGPYQNPKLLHIGLANEPTRNIFDSISHLA